MNKQMLNKAVKNVAVVLLGSLLMMGNAAAANEKVAVVDVGYVAQKLPRMAAIEQMIKDEFKDQIEALEKIRADAKYNYDKLQREGTTLSNEQQDQLKKTILQQQQELEGKGKPLQAQMQRRGGEEQNKIAALIQQAIEAEAKTAGFEMILHKNSVLYMADEDKADISEKIIERVKKMK